MKSRAPKSKHFDVSYSAISLLDAEPNPIRPISRLTRTEKLLSGVDIANENGLEIGAQAPMRTLVRLFRTPEGPKK